MPFETSSARTILVVDDDRHIVRLISYVLETAGYTVIDAANGREALALLAEHAASLTGDAASLTGDAASLTPDLVICDIGMPELDGFAVVEAIRADPETRELPVIMLTAKGEEKDIQKAHEVGANEYITKPFSSSQVLESVARHLGRSTNERSR